VGIFVEKGVLGQQEIHPLAHNNQEVMLPILVLPYIAIAILAFQLHDPHTGRIRAGQLLLEVFQDRYQTLTELASPWFWVWLKLRRWHLSLGR
tara:strand:+ start:370 stop:648 length:279 start_codon:yes stop_codon:yes gene_type:complete